MITKIIGVFLSAVMTFSGSLLISPSDLVDAFYETLFGIPFTSSAIKDDFFANIGQEDIEILDSDSGIVKNKIIIALSDDMDFSERYQFFKNEKLKAVGWCTPVNLYVASCDADCFSDIEKYCKKIEKYAQTLFAMPLTVSRFLPQGTPNDGYNHFDDLEKAEWDELSPAGSEAWLEILNARQAWDYEAYFKPVKLGIVDTGFDTKHSELKGKIKFPSLFMKIMNNPDYHGTHIAGIIAAEKNNGFGVSGLCSNAELICGDFLLGAWGPTIIILFAFAKQVKAGAKIINFSLGKSSSVIGEKANPNDRSYAEDVKLLTYFMCKLLDKGYDFLCIQSSGNGDMMGNPIDAYYNGIFCSINENNNFSEKYGYSLDDIKSRIIVVGCNSYCAEAGYVQSDFSNVGEAVDIVAPGEEIISCMDGDTYVYLSGTSMSTAMVSGVAGLILSVNPDFSAREIKEIILNSYDRTAAKSNNLSDNASALARELPVVNAKLCVEEALRRTYSDIGTVKGRVDLGDGKDATVKFAGKEYTVYSDGSFCFSAQAAQGILEVVGSNEEIIASFEVQVLPGETVEISDLENTVEEDSAE